MPKKYDFARIFLKGYQFERQLPPPASYGYATFDSTMSDLMKLSPAIEEASPQHKTVICLN